MQPLGQRTMNPVLESGTFSGSGIICELFVSEKIYKKRKDIFKKKEDI